MVSLVPSNVLTTQLCMLCPTPAPGTGALQGSLVVSVTARTREESLGIQTPAARKGSAGSTRDGSTGEKQ